MYSTLKRRGNENFHVILKLNTRGVFVGITIHRSKTEIIHLVCSQNFPQIYYFLPPDISMCVSGGKKC